MKGCVYAISLLICTGLAHSITEANDHCVFGSEIMKLNTHMTSYPCMLVRCNPNGRLSFISCPESICNRDLEYKIYFSPANKYEYYPYCCPQTVCYSRKDKFLAMLNKLYLPILRDTPT